MYVRVSMFEVRRTLYGVHVYILNCNTLNSHMLYGAVFIIYCTMYTVHCTLYSVQCTLYRICNGTIYTIYCNFTYAMAFMVAREMVQIQFNIEIHHSSSL